MLITAFCLETALTLLSDSNSDVTLVTEVAADILTAYAIAVMTCGQYFYVQLAIIRHRKISACSVLIPTHKQQMSLSHLLLSKRLFLLANYKSGAGMKAVLGKEYRAIVVESFVLI